MNPILAIFLILLWLFTWLWIREKRSMLNAGVFGMLLACGYLTILELSFRTDGTETLYAYLILALFIGLPLLYVVGSILLVLNGRKMVRNEGLSLAHLLSPLVGSIPVLMVFAFIVLVIMEVFGGEEAFAIGSLLLFLGVGIYGYLLWIAYMTIPYGILYTLIPKNTDVEYIIVHGSGLIDGKVPPLLASRLDKAIEVYNTGGGRATIITSGGQGADESRPEAEAMAEYLMEKAIPAEKIVPEDQSTTTDENMRFSKMIIEKRSKNPGRIVFVTSNYHVFRTALIARNVGLDAQGIGSPTARYYLPSAIIREFIAVTLMYKWWHLLPVALGVAGFGVLAIISLVL